MKFKKIICKSITLFLSLTMIFVFVGLSSAQSGTSSIRGTITDPQGNAVAGVNITLKSVSKSFARTQISNDDGQFVFAAVPPDSYNLEAEANGFKKTIVQDIQALVDTPQTTDVTLELGQVTESVTVSTSNEGTINTTNASIGNTLTTQQIIQLPLSARNTPDLLSLQPGVTPDNGTGNGGAVNGGRSDQGNVTLDGVDVNEQQGGRAFFSTLRVTPESLQEFRVTTTNADANAGRSSGAQISLITKSGSNDIRGSAYLYYRPSTKFQANDFFNNLNGVAQPKRERRNYGGSILGPIKKDRLFFSFFYERFEENKEDPITRTVPLASLGQGIVKYQSTNANLVDPNCPAGTAAGISCKNVAQINAAYSAANKGLTPGINPIALAYLANVANRYKANDFTSGDGLNTAGFRFNAVTPVRNNTYTTRLDGKINDRQDVFFRYQYQFDNSTDRSQFPDTLAPKTWSHPWGVAAGHTWTINNNTVNKFTYGYTRDAFTRSGDSNENLFAFRNVFQPYRYLRTLSRITPVHNFVDDVTFVKGKHTLSAGGNVRLISNSRNSFDASFDNASTNPSFYDESGDVITVGGSLFPDISDDTSLRDALTAIIGRYSQYGVNLQYGKDGKLQNLGAGVPRTFKTQEYEAYLQDSWRVLNNLTVNYGVRWSTSTPVYEANGLQVKPTTSLSDFFNRRVAAAFNGQSDNELLTVDLAGKANNKEGYYKQDWNNFAPAVSAAWSPSFKTGFLKTLFGEEGKSTIRGGFRMTYDRIGSALAVAFDLNSTLGYSSTSSVSANTYNVSDNLGPLFAGLGQNYRNLRNITIAPTLTFPLQTLDNNEQRIEQSLDDKLTTPYNYNFNVSYGREIKYGITVEASYVGRIARSLLVSRDSAHFNNLRDPVSGQDFYGVMRQLIDFRNANASITSIPNIPWFNRFVPGLARNYTINGVSVPLTATQAAYRRVARSCSNNAPRDENNNCVGGTTSIGGVNSTDFTFAQLRWNSGLGAGNNIFVHPQYATFAAYSTIGTSDYHALQMSFRKRFSQGLAFDLNYSYAHSIDTASGNESSGAISSGASLILNPLSLNENRASSDFDVRHLINANFIYELPFGKGRQFFGGNKFADFFIGGWQLTGIYRWNTGFPIGTPFDDARWATNWNVQSNGIRLTGDGSSATKNDVNGVPNIFADPTAAYRSYRNALPGEAGDRNILREPNYVTFDAGLYKSFSVSEKSKITFRLEVFNVTNTQRLTGIADFALGQDPFAPGSNGGTPAVDFGRLTTVQGKPRVVQFALRYDF